MLAQNFRTAAELGISEKEVDALIKVLGMLERGEIPHVHDLGTSLGPDHGTEPVGFNMGSFYARTKCGTVCCICGWAEFVGALKHGSLMMRRQEVPALNALFDPSGRYGVDPITPPQAAIALRSYLTTGEANWADALSS